MVRSNTLLRLTALLAAGQAAAQYTLVDNFDKSNFFKSFDFFSAADPTNGFVNYATARQANDNGLAGFVDNKIFLGVDYKTAKPSGRGRDSVRVTSKKTYTTGLFIADIEHMPVGCGVWPAFWTFGPSWPSSGEIDILEGVNTQSTNAVTLHTSPGCTATNAGSLASTKFANNNADCALGGGTMGCSLHATDARGYGAGFNAIDGGVYAMEWTTEAIRVWFFPRGSAQATALAANSTATPDVASFGMPTAAFGGCDVGKHFQNHNIVLNTALCGDWAGKPEVWNSDATCSQLAPTCQQYVSSTPGAFADAYWLVNSIKVYQTAGAKRRGLALKEFSA